MSDILVPAERPGEWTTLGDHERRIRALEALQPCCDDSGGAFETYADCILANPAVVAYWPLQETTGNIEDVVGDLAGLSGTPEFSDVGGTDYPLYGQPGPFGDSAVEFAGTSGVLGNDDRFDIGGGTLFDIFENDNPFTIDMLTYATADQQGRLFEYFGGTVGQAILIDRGATGRIAFTRTNSTIGGVVETATTIGAWTHVRCSHDGTNIKIFINTIEGATGTGSTTTLTDTGTMRLGNSAGPSWSPFQGRIAHLAIFNDAQTEFCELITPEGPISSTDAEEFMVLTADGAGGTYWAFPTIEVLEDGV